MHPNIQLAVNNYIIDDTTKKAHTVCLFLILILF